MQALDSTYVGVHFTVIPLASSLTPPLTMCVIVLPPLRHIEKLRFFPVITSTTWWREGIISCLASSTSTDVGAIRNVVALYCRVGQGAETKFRDVKGREGRSQTTKKDDRLLLTIESTFRHFCWGAVIAQMVLKVLTDSSIWTRHGQDKHPHKLQHMPSMSAFPLYGTTCLTYRLGDLVGHMAYMYNKYWHQVCMLFFQEQMALVRATAIYGIHQGCPRI